MKAVFIDDSPFVLETFKQLVKELSVRYALEAEFYSDPIKVQAMIAEQKLECDIAFIDINMPSIDGYTLARMLKDHSRYADIPVIAVTSEHKQSSKKRGHEAGFDAWLIKSISRDSLYGSIETLIKAVMQK